MKYIMYEARDGSRLPVIFPVTMDHSDMNKLMQQHKTVLNPVSAGFVLVDESGVRCYGCSMTMQIGSTDEDARDIQLYLKIQY